MVDMTGIPVRGISVGVLVAVREGENAGSPTVLMLQQRGPRNANGEPQSMVGAVQPTAHGKLTPEQFHNAELDAGVNGQAIIDALRDTILPRELGPEFAKTVLEVIEENIAAAEGADRYVRGHTQEVNADGRLVINLPIDLRQRFHVGQAQLVLKPGDRNGEISGFVPWSGGAVLKPMSHEARSSENKGRRVIPEGDLMAFEDDIEFMKKTKADLV